MRRIWLLLWLALVSLTPVGVQAANGGVWTLTIEGVINPLTARYLARELGRAADAQVEAVVVRLNTPGGLETSMREMTQAMLNSSVPVVVYVAPAGGRAASAGMFITIAGHVAAMAPGTNIGAAHPVTVGGAADPVSAEKLTNDAAALARAIATTRGRNAAWVEQAVRESVSITAEEALAENVIDLIANDVPGLLQALDGRVVTTVRGERRLNTADVSVIDQPMSLFERILMVIINPDVAYILFTIGTVGLIAELYNPGSLFPGVTGATALILAFVAFGSLPINWAGALLLVLALGLFVAELQAEGIGLLTVGGLITFILGSMLLFTPWSPGSPALPAVQVNPWLIATMTAAIAAFFLVSLRAMHRARYAPVTTGIEALLGRRGIAVSELAPRGTVRIDSEVWSAVASGEAIHAGEAVRIIGVEGVTLRVTRAT